MESARSKLIHSHESMDTSSLTVEPAREEKIHGDLISGSIYSDGKPRWTAVQDGRVLRVFMSSTFRDMQRERDEFFANAEKKFVFFKHNDTICR